MASETALMCESHEKYRHKFFWASLTPANAAIPHGGSWVSLTRRQPPVDAVNS